MLEQCWPFLFLESAKLIPTLRPLHSLAVLSPWVFSLGDSFPLLGLSSKSLSQRGLSCPLPRMPLQALSLDQGLATLSAQG